jgi:hypothetical protein
MYTAIAAKWWGKEDETLILRDQYDALLVIDTVTPSTLLNR